MELSGVELSGEIVERMRRAMRAAEYTVDGVRELIGSGAHDALARNETTPALRTTTDGSPLATMTRLWPLQAPVTAAEAERALPGAVEALTSAGLLLASAGEVRALVDVRPYSDDGHDWWVVSDLTPGLDGGDRRMDPDHVLGVSSASSSLAQLVDRTPVGPALDLGTGSGVQALHLSTHADRTVATDINPRCIEFASLTASLNEVALDIRRGDLFEPVAGEKFDLIVSNPPFVISPGTDERLVYRDSGLPGDLVVRRVVQEGAAALRAGGLLQVLANWVHTAAEPWDERLASWLAQTRCDGWVVQREQVDPARYVEMWLDDAGLRGTGEYRRRYADWLDWFDDQGVEAIGFGWLTVSRADRESPSIRIESWPYEIEQPIGPAVAAWRRNVDRLGSSDEETILASRLVRADDVVEEQLGTPGDADPAAIVLRSRRGLRRARQVDTAEAALVGACDGDLTVGQIADAVAVLIDRPGAALRSELAAAVPALVLDEFLRFP